MKSKMYLAHAQSIKSQKDNPTLLRIVLTEEYTRIDFGYAAPWKYKKGGWIRIAPHTYIKVSGSKEKYALIKTQNIPISPERHEFESIEDWKIFSLYFEPIPIKKSVIDIIEEEDPCSEDFNYYQITLDEITQCEISADALAF